MNTPRPKRSERAQAQRDRILDAAQACFTEHGFHAASMARIAATAEMSPGLIYRYFKSKNEIIQGIVERQLEWLGEDLAKVDKRDIRLGDVLFDAFTANACHRDQRAGIEPALFLEISAEASRDAQVSATMREFDRELEGITHAWLRGHGDGPDEARLAARTFALRCFIEGLKVRQVREPEIDHAVLREAIEHTLRSLRSG